MPSSAGLTRSKVFLSPLAKTIPARSLTIFGTPEIGASSIAPPAASTAARSASFSFIASVLSSTTTRSLRPARSAPLGPSSTSRTSLYSGSTVTITSHASAIARGDAAGRPPARSSSCIALRRKPWTSNPLAIRFSASGRPIAPRPISPTGAPIAALLARPTGRPRRHLRRDLGPPVGVRAIALRALAHLVRRLDQRVVVPRKVERLGERLLDVPRRVHERLEVVALGIGEVEAPGETVIERRDRLDTGLDERAVQEPEFVEPVEPERDLVDRGAEHLVDCVRRDPGRLAGRQHDLVVVVRAARQEQ